MSNSKIVGIGVALFIFSGLSGGSLAYHQQDVLGDSTTAVAQIDFPPVTDGPGFILPDSPFYTLDRIFQKMKLSAAVSPEEKVKTRMLLIGERMAELRAMMVRKNTVGTQIALDELRSESEKLSYDLRDANGQGKDVKDLSKDINDRLALHRVFLTKVASQADPALSLQLVAANQSLLATKSTAEDFLPDEFLAQAMMDDLESEIEQDVLGVENSAMKLEKRLGKLEMQASKSAEKALKKQIKEDFKTQKNKLLEERKAKLEKLREEKKQRLEEAKEAAKKAREAAKRLKEIREEEKALGEESSGVSQ
jgi:chromosome segregation ATPase